MKKLFNKQEIKKYLTLLVANILLGLSYSGFIIRGNIMTGGLGGLTIFIQYFVDYDLSLVITILSWSLFFIGFIFKGKNFALKTLFSTITYPLAVSLWDILFTNVDIIPSAIVNGNSDVGLQLLYAVLAGVFTGLGLGLAFKVGGSTGGVDIPSVIIAEKFKQPIDRVVFIIDSIIITIGIIPLGFLNVVIGLIANVIYSLMIDKVIVGGQKSICVQIISKDNEKINSMIQEALDRGATFIKAEGAYRRENREILEIVLYRREYGTLIDIIHKVDPDAFVISLEAKEVFGLGFKKYDKETIK